MTVTVPCGCELATRPGDRPPICPIHREDFTPDHVRHRQGRR